jgi:hypothetical protein
VQGGILAPLSKWQKLYNEWWNWMNELEAVHGQQTTVGRLLSQFLFYRKSDGFKIPWTIDRRPWTTQNGRCSFTQPVI